MESASTIITTITTTAVPTTTAQAHPIKVPPTVRRVWINIGAHFSPIVTNDPEVFTLLVDPLDQSAYKIRKHFANQRNVAFIQAGITDYKGLVQFETHNSVFTSVLKSQGAQEQAFPSLTVTALTLADLLDALPAPFNKECSIEFLKTDTQGYDLTILKGAGLSIARVQAIASEVYEDGSKPLYDGSHNFRKEFTEYMDSVGFRLQGQCTTGFKKDGAHELDCIFVNKRCGIPESQTVTQPPVVNVESETIP